MSGDVQPRKRKDKKRKKDDLGLEETRGTSAVFGEGDVFMHSQHDHGTGGHWCAKVIFFSLLAVLVTLIGLIILENRGLTELEANSVESRYSGVLDGWIEEGASDDHHDEHTLDLRHHDDEEGDDIDDDGPDTEIEVERIEREVSEETPISTELPALPETNEDEDKESETDENNQQQEDDSKVEEDDDDKDFIEADEDFDAPVVEHIAVPAGKPFVEVDEDASSEKPSHLVPNTLAEEEEYERKQEELRREEEQSSHKDGGNSVEDEWPGEPSDSYWRERLDKAEEDLSNGAWSSCERVATASQLSDSGRARWLVAKALDLGAEQRRDNTLLSRAIAAYLHLLKMHERLSDKKLLQVTERVLNRIQFRGTYLSAEPVYRLLIRRFPDNPAHRNNLSTAFLMANRADLAEPVLKDTLQRWPGERLALAHYGFVLKTQHNRLEEAVEAFYRALEGDRGPANEARFYYHLGDSLLLLGRHDEAYEVHKRGAKLGHFLSPVQRSLYNVPRLNSQPWWNIADTPYINLARSLERSWKEILKEAEAAKKLYEEEKEGLKARGEWSQLDLFVRGREIEGRCKNAPVTCGIVRSERAAGCRRGQVKFSALAAGTHVRAHVGPTNCRLRMHLALSNTKDTYIRVDKEIRQWQLGKVFMFDDSFEHEVWHNGSGTRLVLIVDVWHPDLTPAERRQLPAI